MFAKIMSISDTMMWKYYELLSFRSLADLAALKAAVDGGANPRDAKVALAQGNRRALPLAGRGRAGAERLRQPLQRRDSRRYRRNQLAGRPIRHPAVAESGGLCASVSEAGRMIEQGGVRIDGTVISDKTLKVDAGTMVLQVGKRKFARVTLTA
jgi:tyrosyl-tRNA synthetase